VKPRRITLRSTLAGVAALVALSLTATACDTSPYAAKVNAQVIHQAALNAELRAWSGNAAYVSSYNSASNGSGTVAGDAPGTYSTTWVATVLGGMVVASVVNQDLVAKGQQPSAATLAAARSVNQIAEVGWQDFSPEFRDVLVQRLAEEAVITPVSVSEATLLSTYNQYKQQYFFLSICTAGSSAFSASEAASIAAQGVPNGVSACYNQAQFESQPAAFQSEVRSLAVGAVSSPIKTSYGYQVVRLVSRDLQPFSPDLQRVLSLVIMSSQGSANPALNTLLAKASVHINPAYGTWSSMQVKPPSVPNSGS
jgi:hypothetical protein